MSTDRILAEVRDYAQLVAALRSWVDQLGQPGEIIDEIAGLPNKYTRKLLAAGARAADRNRGRGIGRTSLGPLLGALGLKLHVVVDTAVLAQISRNSKWRKNASTGMPTRKTRKIRRYLAFKGNPALARHLAAQRLLSLSPERRSAIARTAARERWRRPAV